MHKTKYALVTGSSGLIGSESVKLLISKGFLVVGIDNNMRAIFFGREGSTDKQKQLLIQNYPKLYIHYSVDIRDTEKIKTIFKKYPFDLIIHTAAQPSHDWAATHPLIDFSINAMATVNLLENFRKYCPKAVFIFTSTNKVYGDTPNRLPLIEYKTRYDLPKKHLQYFGINESMSIDNSTHSVFGVGKLSADVMTQEYGKYYHLHTGVFRCGCMTGPTHAGTLHHGFLSYLVKSLKNNLTYRIIGFKGKQVRDNIHAKDVIDAFFEYYQNPRFGEVYNLGGGRTLSISIIEAAKQIEKISGQKTKLEISDKPRTGDHKWYITDNSKFISHFPNWKLSYSITEIISEIYHNS